jgi:hypothetical protein
MTSDLEIYPDTDRTPSTLFASPDPAAIVAQATRIANEIAPLIREQRLVKRIGQSDHVFLEGWTLAGTMLGVFPITVSSGPIVHEGEVLGYQATVEARTMAGNMVGRADAQCTHDENAKWRDAPSFQLRSMAITRASSKALRMPLGFVMHLAGYDATPAEEMEAAAGRGETVTGGRGVRPGWRDLAEQQRAHAEVGRLIDEHGLRSWVASWLESKSYERPLAKGQLSQLRKAIEREVAQMSDPPGPVSPPADGRGGSDPTSPASGRGRQSSGTATSGAGEREDVGSHLRPDRHDLAPDLLSPSADPIDAHEAQGTAGQGGDANAGPAESDPPRANGVPTVDTGDSAGPAYPVEEWAINQDPPVDLRQAKVALRKQFREDFGWLKDWKDLQELQGEQAANAIKALEAIYLDPGEGKP